MNWYKFLARIHAAGYEIEVWEDGALFHARVFTMDYDYPYYLAEFEGTPSDLDEKLRLLSLPSREVFIESNRLGLNRNRCGSMTTNSS